MKNILYFFCVMASSLLAAQAPEIQWQRTFGGTGSEYAKCVRQAHDGGYIVIGTTPSNNGDVSGNHGNNDLWMIKLDPDGELEWQKCLGGTGSESGNAIRLTADGGYIIAGDASSNNGDVSGGNGSNDFWIVKIDHAGIIQWQNSLGGSGGDHANDIDLTSDGGYIAAGTTSSNNGDVTGNHGGISDGWVVKLNHTGDLEWQTTVGGSGTDQFRSVSQTIDGGYIAAGITNSNDGDVSGNHGSNDFWVVKLSATGELQWQKTLGGTGSDVGQYIVQNNDGTYMAIGTTSSFNGDVSGNHGGSEYWMIKLSETGTMLWQKCIGGTSSDIARAMQPTNDGGFIITGNSSSNDYDASYTQGLGDFWVVKIDALGNVQWEKSMGGTGADDSTSVQETSDGGFIITGQTTSTDGDITENKGIYDFWVVKLEAPAMSLDDNLWTKVKIYPNPANKRVQVETTFTGATIKIMDIQGKQIAYYNTTSPITTIDTGALVDGMYILQITHGNSVLNKKLIITN